MITPEERLKSLVESILEWFPGAVKPQGLTGVLREFKQQTYYIAEPELWYSVWELIPPKDRYIVISDNCLASGEKWCPIEIAPMRYLLIGGGRWTPELIQQDLKMTEQIRNARSLTATDLGRAGGQKTAERGPEYFRRISAMRKSKKGGRTKKDATSPSS